MARIARIGGGVGLIVIGTFMLVLPGPGIITIIGGLALLAQDVPWAGRLRDWARAKLGQTDGADDPLDGKADPAQLGG
jgi:hypothetical protein